MTQLPPPASGGAVPPEVPDDRSWLRRSPAPVDEATILGWQQEVDARYRDARSDLDGTLGTGGSPDLVPGISAVVLPCRDHRRLARCLRSLTGQTLDPARFEVVVILSRPSDELDRVVGTVRGAHPQVTLRVIRLDRTGVEPARDAGIAAAGRDYLTFVDGADYVSAGFLEVLLASAGPRVLPVAPVVDVPDGEEEAAGDAGRTPASPAADPGGAAEPGGAADGAEPVDLAAVAALDGAKVAATPLLQALRHRPAPPGGEDATFWMAVLVRGRLRVHPCPPAAGARYYRAVRPETSPTDPGFDAAVGRRLAAVVRLEELLDHADPGTAEVLREQIGAQADGIGAYLRHHPADHGRVVRALDRLPIRHLPYARMNRTLPRGLAIAYAFPPYADTSAIVSAKRVRARGEVVDVVSNAMDRIRDTDESIRRISGPFVADEAALPTPTYFSDWASMEAFAVEGLRVIDGWEAARGPYHRLYSRAHFAASHLLAAAYKLRRPAVRWSAEFSDPLSRDVQERERGTPVREGALLDELRRGMRDAGVPVPASRNCFVWCEELAYALADELIFTNQQQLDHMLGYCTSQPVAARARAKAVISPQPTLPPEFYTLAGHEYPLEAGVAHLGYFGNFYATRGLDDVLAALAALAGDDPGTGERVRLHVFTTKPDELDRRARELGVAGLVRVGPYLRYLEFLRLTRELDCLVVNDAATGGRHGRNPYLPSKWADYRGSGTPVWGIVEPGSPLSGEPLDYASPVGDVAAAREVLSVIARKELAG